MHIFRSAQSRYLLVIIGILLAFPVFQAVRELLTVAWILRDPLVYVSDTTIYWGLGRAFLNGLTLYKDIFDNKPLGMPLLSAASLLLFGNGAFGSFLGALAVLLLPTLPILFLWMSVRREHPRGVIIPLLLFTFFFSSLLTLYHVQRSEPWQSEFYGGFAAVLYVFCVYRDPGTMPWWRVVCAGLALLVAAGIKEPFFVSCLACALVIDPHPRAMLRSFIVPAALALFLGIVTLFLLGSLGSYLSIYLPGVFAFRVSSFGSPWMRGFLLFRVIGNIVSFSAPLAASILLLGVLAFVQVTFDRVRSMQDRVIRVMAYLFAVYCMTFAVGLGGDFQAHHFSFALPFYVTLLFLGMRWVMQRSDRPPVRVLSVILLIVSVIAFLRPPSPLARLEQLRMENIGAERLLRPAASALDAIMDACALDRYLYVEGAHGRMLYGFTRHSPENYLLFWELDNAVQYGVDVANISFKHISRADILVIPKDAGFRPRHDMGNVIAQYFVDTFTAEVPPCARNLPGVPAYYVYFRKVEKELPLHAELGADGGLVVRKIEK